MMSLDATFKLSNTLNETAQNSHLFLKNHDLTLYLFNHYTIKSITKTPP
ncbi:hypothetical protein DSUL_60072 [Desulfovibrionales bacterium]